MWVHLLLISAVALTSVHNAKILGVFHMSSRSHYILGSSLMRGLAERGHDVTLVAPYGEKDPPKNGSYRDIILTGFVEEHDKIMKSLNMYKKNYIPMAVMAPFMSKLMIDMTERTLNNTNLQKLIHSGETFDIVIVEEFLNHAHKALATHFKAHLVVFSSIGASSWVNSLIGNPAPLSYCPDMLLGYPSHMNFYQRLTNTVNYLWSNLINEIYVIPKQNQLIQKYFPNGPDVKEVMYNVSLVLLNSHSSTNQPVPYVPQMVDIGGFHVKPPKKLPKDLQEYMDNSKNGVIYFSLGSNVKGSDMPVETRQILTNIFSKLKQDVLWKWEQDDLPGKPSNVRLGKWLPQQDILAHPNLKLFITHAGLLSTIETIYHGVPVLAIPLGGDQVLNAQQMVNQGFGLALGIHDLTEEEFLNKIKLLLNDPTYRENAKAKSEIFHDRMVKPLDTAGYWIEYVLRYGGTTHLRVAGLDLPWYKYLLLDVVAVLTVGILVFVYASIIVCKLLFRSCLKQKKRKLKNH